jgi:ABC-type amino acid transport substrate-binding protein
MCVHPHLEPLHVGISADIIALIARRLELTIELVPTNTWEESLEFSKEKRCDILSFINQTSENAQWLIFTEPIFKDTNEWLAKQAHKIIMDLKNVRIGVLKEDVMLRNILNLGIARLTQADIDTIVSKHVPITVEKINSFTVGFYMSLGLLMMMIALIALWKYILRRNL